MNGLVKYSRDNFSEGYTLTKDDYVIVLGDFGIPWANKISNRYIREVEALHWLSSRPWTTLFIDGNHENFDNLKGYTLTEKFGGTVAQIDDTVYHLRRGSLYIIEGKKFFTFGGATSIDKKYRIESISWWKDENPSREEIDCALDTLDACNYEVDYVLTHAVPTHILKDMLRYYKGTYYEYADSTVSFLDEIDKYIKCKRWFFGHYHIDYQSSIYSRPIYSGFMWSYGRLDTNTDSLDICCVKTKPNQSNSADIEPNRIASIDDVEFDPKLYE